MGAWYNGYEFSNVKVYNNLTDEETIDKVGNQETESTWVEQAEKKNNLISKESFLDYVITSYSIHYTKLYDNKHNMTVQN